MTEETKRCRCNTQEHDPNCHIDHTLSTAEAEIAFPTWSPEQDPLRALDELLKAVGNLPMNFILSRPPLQGAVNRGLEVLDQAVREGRYVVPSGE